MATITETLTNSIQAVKSAYEASAHRQPLKLSGALDKFDFFDVTPVIGKEFPTANLKDWSEAPNADELLRDLAITSTMPVLVH